MFNWKTKHNKQKKEIITKVGIKKQVKDETSITDKESHFSSLFIHKNTLSTRVESF